jgi:hypothetical protein
MGPVQKVKNTFSKIGQKREKDFFKTAWGNGFCLKTGRN